MAYRRRGGRRSFRHRSPRRRGGFHTRGSKRLRRRRSGMMISRNGVRM